MKSFASFFWLGLFIRDSESLSTRQRMTMAYCVKCRAQREIKNPLDMTMKNGKKAVTGTCPVCGTKLFRIGGYEKPSVLLDPILDSGLGGETHF